MRSTPLLMVLLLLASPVGCGGDSHDPADDDAGTGGTDAGVPADGGGGGIDAGGDAGDGADGSIMLFDAGDGADGGGGGSDGGTTGRIDCGMSTCDATTEQCCVTGGAGSGAMYSCIPVGGMCMGVAADCDGPEDCAAGEECCARFGGGSLTVMCVPGAMCGGGGFGSGFELCHTAADCSDAMAMCCPFMMFGVSTATCQPMCFAMP